MKRLALLLLLSACDNPKHLDITAECFDGSGPDGLVDGQLWGSWRVDYDTSEMSASSAVVHGPWTGIGDNSGRFWGPPCGEPAFVRVLGYDTQGWLVADSGPVEF